jgi:hypothetical protein
MFLFYPNAPGLRLTPILLYRPSLRQGLFAVVDRGGADGQENEYVMKAIMRLLTVVQVRFGRSVSRGSLPPFASLLFSSYLALSSLPPPSVPQAAHNQH